MILDEAIKLLYKYRHIDDDLCIEDVNTALELGIEAQKLYKRMKADGLLPEDFLLPGETPIINNHRSLHHIKQLLENSEVSK